MKKLLCKLFGIKPVQRLPFIYAWQMAYFNNTPAYVRREHLIQ